MKVTLAASGGGTKETMTVQCARALEDAQYVIGAGRLLAMLGPECSAQKIEAVYPDDVCREVLALKEMAAHCVVLYSGDTGFYSGASPLVAALRENGIEVEVLPGVSSVQLFAAKLGRPWQDWKLVSAHGTQCDAAAELDDRPAFFLTGGRLGPAELCRQLCDAGLGDLRVLVGENLSYPDERVTEGTAAECAEKRFVPLSVLLAESAPQCTGRTPGWPDDSFVRADVPMTKQEVRAAALAKLGVRPGDVCWDVGAGTGSVSVELALCQKDVRVWAVECEPQACALIRRNQEKFGARNLTLIEGRAPEALDTLPAPDAVFIGGTKGGMQAVVDAVLAKNPSARICISAIALETLSVAVETLAAHGLDVQVTQISVSRTRPAGKLHLLMANNPVFLIAGNCS